MLKNKLKDLIIWSIVSFFGLFFTLILKPNILVGVLLSFMPGIIFLSFKLKKNLVAVAILSSFIFGLLCGIPFEYVNYTNNSWYYFNNQFIIKDFIFGIPFEVLLWYFLWVFSTITFYEYFIDQKNKFKFKLKLLWLSPILLIWIFMFLGKNIVLIYPYLITGIFATLPAVYFLYKKRNFNYKKMLIPTLFLGVFFFLKELVALYHGYWSFTGDYIYIFTFFGKTLPIEELFFWIIASPFILICYHELFVDDGK